MGEYIGYNNFEDEIFWLCWFLNDCEVNCVYFVEKGW